MTRLRIDVAYDGTAFHGWARQEGLRTVQGEIESWLNRLIREIPVELTVAGRTDAGVHARGQVAHIDVPDALDVTWLHRTLIKVLPADIVLRDLGPAPAGFDARFSAIWRRYCYRIWDSASTPDPLVRTQVTQVNEALDVDLMNQAGAMLVGLHDFAPFCKRREGATTIRRLESFHACRCTDPCATIECWLQADAFCHSMVRSLIGAVCAVGSGRRSLAWLADVQQATQRSGDVHVMKAQGLCLEAVGYPADDQLATRALQARAQRTRDELRRVP